VSITFDQLGAHRRSQPVAKNGIVVGMSTAARQPNVKGFDLSSVDHLVLAGWAGRDTEAVEAHIRELELLGLTRPTRTPVYYRVSSSLLTTTDAIEVVGEQTSGEVEFVLVMLRDGLHVGLGSDHTDRGLEPTSVALSKQLCAKVVAHTLWSYDDVAPHWDRLVLRSWAHRGGRRERYQESSVATLLPVERLISLYESAGRLNVGTALFSGTVATVNSIAPAERFEMELDDPVLDRRLHHSYRIATLPVNA
jgi:hypothetical protein